MDLVLDGHRVWSGVISRARSERVGTFAPRLPPSTWYVPEDEVDDYRSAGVLAEPEPGRGPAAARNAVLDAAPSGVPAAVFDDDPMETPRFLIEPKRTVPVDPGAAVAAVLGVMARTGASLGGVNEVGNAAWVEPGVTERNIGNVFVVAADCPLRFDEDLPNYGEDMDYNAQHLVRGTGLARLDYLLWRFHIGDQPGSLSETRTGARDAAAILVERWPGLIVDDGTIARFRRPRARV